MRGIYDRGKQLYSSKGRKRTIAYSTALERAFVGMSSLNSAATLSSRLDCRSASAKSAPRKHHGIINEASEYELGMRHRRHVAHERGVEVRTRW